MQIERPSEAELERLRRGELPDGNMWWSWWGGFRNFGDWIGPYLYRKRTGTDPRFCAPGHVPEGITVHFTCGSIIQKIRRKNRAEIWGSGIKTPDDFFMRPKAVHAVRGPLTQQVIARRGFDVPDVMGDPGLCLPHFYRPADPVKTHRLAIVPHVYDLPFWQRNMGLLPDDVRIIDLRQPVEQVVDHIVASEAVLSSSLHGIIESHAYGVPCGWLASFSAELMENDFKFQDYFRSVGMEGMTRIKIRLPFDSADYRQDLSLPDADLTAIGDRLLAVCPF